MKLLLVLAAAVPLMGQPPPQCTSYSLSTGGFVSSAAATDTSSPGNIPKFTVTTQAICPFVATSSVTWLHALPPTSGTNFVGTSTVSVTVDQNTTAQLRTGQIQIYAGTQVTPGASFLGFTVTQVAGICNYSISPTSASVPVGGGSGTFTVNTGCAWGATFSDFITLTAPSGTVGTQPLNYQLAANTCAAPRTGLITVQTSLPNPPVFRALQDGSLSNFSLSATSVTDASTALANQKVSVTTGLGCTWTVYTDSPGWLHPILPGAVSGSGTLVYSVDANPGGQRSGHIFFQSGADSQGNPILAATLTVIQQTSVAPGPVLSAVVNDASYDIGTPGPPPISPGEIVALFGTNMGPAAPVVNTQTFGTNLGGVQVMFGSTPAPLIYVSAQQINAVVPYAVAGTGSTAVTVQYAAAISPVLTVPVRDATPGIFSNDHLGSGPGAILNQDNGLNSSARPATAGSVIAIYCTGAGVTSPASKDGAPATATPPFPTLATQPVTVTIGGISAQVVYAGPAPGLINGLTQIDAVVPAGVKPGSSVPVVVTIGGVSSQGNLSMAVQ